MIQVDTFKPKGGWWCALCYPHHKEQGEWFCNVTDGEGRTSSFICDKHKHLTLGEIVEKLNEKQNRSDKLNFIPSDEGTVSNGWKLTNEYKLGD